MANTEGSKSKLEEIFETWVADLISSALGIALVIYGSTADILPSGRFICIILGILFQIPLVYFKIYQTIFNKK